MPLLQIQYMPRNDLMIRANTIRFDVLLLGDPGVNCFFFFGLIGFHGSVRLEMILLHFASFPLNDTPKPAGAVFIRWLIEPHFFGSGIFDMALDMIGRLIYQIKQVFLCTRCLFPHTRFPSLARQHVGMLWMHISHTITHEYCHFHIPTIGTHW